MIVKIRELRKIIHISQKELSDITQIGRSTLSEIESGKHIPHVDAAIKISRALHTTVEKIFILDSND